MYLFLLSPNLYEPNEHLGFCLGKALVQTAQLYRRNLPAQLADKVGDGTILAFPHKTSNSGGKQSELVHVLVRYVISIVVTQLDFSQSLAPIREGEAPPEPALPHDHTPVA